MEEEIDLQELFLAFWSKKIWIIIAIVLASILGVVYTKFIVVPKYASSVTLILGRASDSVNGKPETDYTDTITQADIMLNQKLISTYREIMKSRTISNTVIKNLGLTMSYEEIKKCIDVSAIENTDVIKLTITTDNPTLSADIASEMIKVFTDEIVNIYNIQNISIIDEAEVNENPINVSYVKNVAIFAMIAFILAAGVIFIIFYFDNTIKSEEDIKNITGLPVLCSVPKFDDLNGGMKDDEK